MTSESWDAREIPQEKLQAALFKELDQLKHGEQFVAVLNVAPEPFIDPIRQRSSQYSFASKRGQGDEWILEVSRATLAEIQSRGCCGVCGGGGHSAADNEA